MTNEKLQKALEIFSKKIEHENDERARTDALSTAATFDFIQYRNGTLVPILEKIRHQLLDNGHGAQLIVNEDIPTVGFSPFIELRVKLTGAPTSDRGPTAIFVVKNGLEFIGLKERPKDVNFWNYDGVKVDPSKQSEEDMVVNFLVSALG